MTFKTDLVALLNPVYGGNLFLVTAPDGFVSATPFGIAQVVGGRDAFYVDQSLGEIEQKRVQLWTWGTDLGQVEVTAAAARAQLANSINILNSNFVGVTPEGAETDDYNDVLKRYGSRQDFLISWKNPAIL